MAITSKKQATYTYVLKEERGEENPFTVTFKTLTSKQLGKLDDGLVSYSQDNNININQGSQAFKVFSTAVTNWSGWNDENDEPVSPKFNRDGTVDSNLLDELPNDVLKEVSDVIQLVSKERDKDMINVYLGIE